MYVYLYIFLSVCLIHVYYFVLYCMYQLSRVQKNYITLSNSTVPPTLDNRIQSIQFEVVSTIDVDVSAIGIDGCTVHDHIPWYRHPGTTKFLLSRSDMTTYESIYSLLLGIIAFVVGPRTLYDMNVENIKVCVRSLIAFVGICQLREHDAHVLALIERCNKDFKDHLKLSQMNMSPFGWEIPQWVIPVHIDVEPDAPQDLHTVTSGTEHIWVMTYE